MVPVRWRPPRRWFGALERKPKSRRFVGGRPPSPGPGDWKPVPSQTGDRVQEFQWATSQEEPHDHRLRHLRSPRSRVRRLVVSVLLGGAPPSGVEIDETEQAALDALAGSGLVPPLRLVLPLEVVVHHDHGPPAAEVG